MLADELDYVVGVDTHRDEHVLAVVAAPSGAVLARRAVRANARGYSAALRFAGEAAGGVRVWAIEGTGSYGAGLAAAPVLRPSRAQRSPTRDPRCRLRSDATDRPPPRALLRAKRSAQVASGRARATRQRSRAQRAPSSGGTRSTPRRSGERFDAARTLLARHRSRRGRQRSQPTASSDGTERPQSA